MSEELGKKTVIHALDISIATDSTVQLIMLYCVMKTSDHMVYAFYNYSIVNTNQSQISNTSDGSVFSSSSSSNGSTSSGSYSSGWSRSAFLTISS